ncbi:DUF4407 domain-containing protein [Actinomadura soli]|nr:DUF4407 domain-containing protein [Actinomadura soli]
MRDFLVSLSGARPDVLKQCPSDRVKFEGVGGAVLTTSVLATLSMWFALNSAVGVHPLLAVPVALVWGLIIMSLDRWLVSTIPAEGARRWKLAAPRLVMALLLGAVISTPLVLQIFHAEIDAQIVEIRQRRADTFLRGQERSSVGQQVAAWRKTVTDLQRVVSSNGDVPLDPSADPRIRGLTGQRDAAQRQADTSYRKWQCQLYGGEGCTRKGDGPLARASQEDYRKARAQVDALNSQIEQRKRQLTRDDDGAKRARLDQARTELPKAQAQLDAANRRQNDLQQSFDARNEANKGLLLRLQALNEVSGRDSTLQTAQFLLFLLFLMIECLPVAVKLMMRPGNYEKILKLVADQEIWEARGAYGARYPRSGPAPDQAAAPDQATAPDSGIRDIWYNQESLSAQDPFASRAPAPRSEPAEAMADPASGLEAAAFNGESHSIDDAALRGMKDTRTSQIPEPPERQNKIQLYDEDDDFF